MTLDYDALTVSRNGQSQTLPQKEFYLLYKLLSYPDTIFTRLQLMDEIWGMESETVDTSELSTSVLNLSRIEQQTILSEKKRFNVSEQIRLVIAMMYSKWPDKHIHISFDSEEIYVVGNEEMLKQVWINLIDNAIKFSPEYGKVDVKAVQSQDNTIFTFTDCGKGMSEETAAHIFEKFYQGDTSHSVKGNGLGLTIAKKIIELHGGTIYVSSTGQNGSVFTVEIPTDKKNSFD